MGRPDMRREAGLTLVELMVVVVLVSILAITVGRGMTRTSNAGAAADWARRVWVVMRQARALAVDSGAIVQVVIRDDGKRLSVSRHSLIGPPPLPNPPTWLLVSTDDAPGGATIVGYDTNTIMATVASPSALSSTVTVTFLPDGSLALSDASAGQSATIYVRDDSGTYKHKVLVYELTGMAHHITRW